MLVVKTKLKETKDRGIGLFADEPIKKGQSVWKFHPLIDIKIKKSEIPSEAKDFFETYSVDIGEKNSITINTDNARFINHSDTPNTKNLGAYKDNVAIKNIKKGEEITIDYRTIDIRPLDF